MIEEAEGAPEAPAAAGPPRGGRDRKLGDEWLDWAGGSESSQRGKGLFATLLSLAYIGFTLALLLLYYLAVPRLAQFHPSLPRWSGIGGALLLALLALWAALLLLSLKLERNLLGPLLPRRGIPESWSRAAGRLGGWFGLSRDSLGNSFIKLHNSHVRLCSRRDSLSGRDLLVLLPRCLDHPTREKIRQLQAELGLAVHTAAGGDAARELIARLRPRAVIAVACERDLLTGIRDVAARVPVIGIPNERPHGPCKNTWIDVALLENDIRYLISGRS